MCRTESMTGKSSNPDQAGGRLGRELEGAGSVDNSHQSAYMAWAAESGELSAVSCQRLDAWANGWMGEVNRGSVTSTGSLRLHPRGLKCVVSTTVARE